MAELNFNIISSKDCSKLEFQNCSTYCTGETYTPSYCLAYFNAWSYGGSSAGTKMYFYAAALTTAATWTYTWTIGAYSGSGTSTTTLIAVPSVPLNATTTLTLVVTDADGLVSTSTSKIKRSAGGTVTWFVSPRVSISPLTNTTLNSTFAESSVLTTTTVPATIDFDVNSTITDPDSAALPYTHAFATSNTTYVIDYSYAEAVDSTAVNVTFRYKLTTVTSACTSSLTSSGITDVSLQITDPDGTSETEDITDSFLNAPFNILQTDVTTLDFTNSGIWRFDVTVTKVDGSTYIFSKCKNIVINCDIKCRYSKLLAKKAHLDKDCVDCEEVKLNQIFQISMLLDGLEDLIACMDTEGINNVITLLEALLANTDCSCG